jgi:hypothetical protein
MRTIARSIVARIAAVFGGPSDGTDVALDANGRGIALDEISIRAVLCRMDALDVERVGDATIRVRADALAEAIADPDHPIHHDIPNRCAGAPLRARRALRRLHAVGAAAAASGDTMDLRVPVTVAAWSALRARRKWRALDRMWG